MNHNNQLPHRAMIAGIASMAPVRLGGQDYAAGYLSAVLAIDPEQPAVESARTPQLISEFGRLTAASLRQKELAELYYRVWRDGEVTKVCTDLEYAVEQGFAKLPSNAAADAWVRTLPKYVVNQEAIIAAGEVWATMHACHEAALARSRAVYAFERQGAGQVAARDDRPDADGARYTGGYSDGQQRAPEPVAGIEAEVAAQAPTAIPARAPGPPPAPPKVPPAPPRPSPYGQ